MYVWDLRTQRCLQRYTDEGCLNGTSLACSPDADLFATGSSSGVVNLYSRAAQGLQGPRRADASWATPEAPVAGAAGQRRTQLCRHMGIRCLMPALLTPPSCSLSHSPRCYTPAAGKPIKTVLNLATQIDTLAFNHDGQMLVMGSRLKRDALRCGLQRLCAAPGTPPAPPLPAV